jgi:hypothetical protein
VEAERVSAITTSYLIAEQTRSLDGWRAKTLTEVRRLIHKADPDIIEEYKWIKPSKIPPGCPSGPTLGSSVAARPTNR